MLLVSLFSYSYSQQYDTSMYEDYLNGNKTISNIDGDPVKEFITTWNSNLGFIVSIVAVAGFVSTGIGFFLRWLSNRLLSSVRIETTAHKKAVEDHLIKQYGILTANRNEFKVAYVQLQNSFTVADVQYNNLKTELGSISNNLRETKDKLFGLDDKLDEHLIHSAVVETEVLKTLESHEIRIADFFKMVEKINGRS